MESPFKYFAFISYNHADIQWGKRLQRKLEHYRLPATLCSEHGWPRTPINPVFFAPSDIQPGGLTDEIQGRLSASRHLIVVCSPQSARAKWVGEEIAFFHSLGRSKNIHLFIVEGKPHSDDPDQECIHPIIKQLGLPEILGANVHDQVFRLSLLNRERAYVQLISKLLGVEFDTIWKRHRRLLRQKVLAGIVALLVVVGGMIGIARTNRLVDVVIQLREVPVVNSSLPGLDGAIVSLSLEGDRKVDTVLAGSCCARFEKIPYSQLRKAIPMEIRCPGFRPVDSTLVVSSETTIALYRDPAVYGHIRVRVWDIQNETDVPYFKLFIAGFPVESDASGYVSLDIPLSDQRTSYEVSAVSGTLLTPILYMPCTEETAILIQNQHNPI